MLILLYLPFPNEYDLTAAVEGEGYSIIEPLWCERKLVNYAYGNPVWVFVPTVNVDTQSDRRVEHILTVSYYGDNPNQITAVFSAYGNEIIAPNSYFRIWYAPQNVFTSSIGATVSVPQNLTALVVCDIKIIAFAQMQIEAAKYIDKRPELAPRIKSWDRMTMELERQKVGWDRWFDSFCKRSRSAHRALDHIDVLQQHQALTGGPGRSGIAGWN